ncbi:response regulator [Roseomonas sp. CCTCC AB2023176]|uniref:response regulator n=1 Tax=Roseomonas sp. CCTCC AB2023176 TaxID=3342640 RepID=UPI0035E29FBC
MSGTGVLTRLRVLVVEDEYFIADDMVQALEALGAKVVGPVASLAGVMGILASGERIDAGVLDIDLRGEAVYPVADILTERGVPYIFATGYDKTVIPRPYQSVPRWEKPFDSNALARALPHVVAAYAPDLLEGP